MNVAISTLVSSTKPNGLRNYILSLIESIDSIEIESKIYIITNKEFLRCLKLRKKNVEIILVNIPHSPRFIMRPVFFIWQNSFYFLLKRKYNIKVFHSPNPAPYLFKPAQKFIVTIHDLAEHFGLRHSWFKRKLRIYFNRISLSKADKILTVSNFSKSTIEQVFPKLIHKVEVVYPSVLERNQDPKKDIENKVPKSPFFLYIGTNYKHKNLVNVIEAFRSAKIDPAVELVLVGNIDVPKSIKEDKLLIKRLKFLGIVSDDLLQKLYSKTIALLFPSLYEGFGFPILEAMLKGVPVITSNTSATVEISGRAALLVDPTKTKEIRIAVEQVYNKSVDLNALVTLGFKNAKKYSKIEFGKRIGAIYSGV